MVHIALEQVLAQDPHIVSIIPSKYTIPPDVDYSLFELESQTIIDHGLDVIKTYLQYNIIIDNFTTHEERRAWRKTLSAEVHSYYKQNKLRRNPITGVIGYIAVLDMCYIGPNKDEVASQAEKISQTINLVKEDYLDVNDKITMINTLDTLIYSFLDLIAIKK